MKTYPRLFDKITDWDNLILAAKKARQGKRFDPSATRFSLRLESELLRLQRELQSQTYRPGLYHTFLIHDPKQRMISAAPFRDRVVHHALVNVIEPIFEKTFVHGRISGTAFDTLGFGKTYQEFMKKDKDEQNNP